MLARYVIASVGLAIAAPLSAGTPNSDEPSQTMVYYYDLDLTKESDVAELNRRVRRAAERVCPYRHETMNLSRQRIAAKCVAETIAQSSARVAQAVQVDEDRKAQLLLATR